MPIETPEAPKPSIEALHAMLPAFIASATIRQTAPRFAASLLARRRKASRAPACPTRSTRLALPTSRPAPQSGKQNSLLGSTSLQPKARSSRPRSRPAGAHSSPGST